MNIDVVLVGAVIAGILAGIELFQSRAESLVAWAVLILAIALIIVRIR